MLAIEKKFHLPIDQCGQGAVHTASRTGSSVAGLEGLLALALAEIVGAGVDDDGTLEATLVLCSLLGWGTLIVTYADDALRADELDELVGHRALGVALSIGLDVAEVTDVAGLVRGSSVSLAEGVDLGKSR